MLFENTDGTYTAGLADVLCIVQVPSGTFHVSFWEEHPMPGPVPTIAASPLLRLKSKMHHTSGAPTLAEAQVQLDDMRKHIVIDDANVVRTFVFQLDDPVTVQILPNWIRAKQPLEQVLAAGSLEPGL